uniref:Xylose isomerase n=1 Tax=Oryza rufipogon TaxID=4529 RepID=A0A0E0NDV7_ORYRU
MSCAAAFTSSNGPLTMKKERERARARGDGERKAGSEFPSFLRSNWWCLHQQAFYNVECRRPRPQPPSSGLDSTGNSSDISSVPVHLLPLRQRLDQASWVGFPVSTVLNPHFFSILYTHIVSYLTQHLDLLNDRSPHLLLHHKGRSSEKRLKRIKLFAEDEIKWTCGQVRTVRETNKNLDEIVEYWQRNSSPEVKVYAYGVAQVKKTLEVTHYLRGENYVFWGGREGYQTLLNTDMKRELDHLANFLQATVDYKKNGFRAYNRNLPFYSSRRRARGAPQPLVWVTAVTMGGSRDAYLDVT